MSELCKHGRRNLDTNLPYCRQCDAEAKSSLAPVSGSDADVMREKRVALKFAEEWLWRNPGRRTTGSEWPSDYLHDAASMIAEYHLKHQNDQDEPRG